MLQNLWGFDGLPHQMNFSYHQMPQYITNHIETLCEMSKYRPCNHNKAMFTSTMRFVPYFSFWQWLRSHEQWQTIVFVAIALLRQVDDFVCGLSVSPSFALNVFLFHNNLFVNVVVFNLFASFGFFLFPIQKISHSFYKWSVSVFHSSCCYFLIDGIRLA